MLSEIDVLREQARLLWSTIASLQDRVYRLENATGHKSEQQELNERAERLLKGTGPTYGPGWWAWNRGL